MKTVLKIVLWILVILLAVVLLAVAVFGVHYWLKSHGDTSSVGKTQTKYHMNAEGVKIENIPYDHYIGAMDRPENALVPAISESAGSEANSRAINEAIASLSPGGTVYIPAGEYKISTVYLKSDTTLFISAGARLISLDCEENEKSDSPLDSAVIYGENCENVTVTGGGKICGMGETYTEEAQKTEPFYALKNFNLYTRVIESRKRIRFAKDVTRNQVLCLENCKNVTVSNIILEESAAWTFVIRRCDGVQVHNIVIDNHMHVANTDGIDICTSRNVTVKNSFIATADDAVVLKSTEGEISNVTVENCELSSFANCFKIGTETPHDVSGVTVKKCHFFLPDNITGGYSGIAIESADGANISDVTVDGITMDGISAPLLIWLGCRLKYDNQTVGSIKNVFIGNITAENTEMPSAVTGCQYKGKVYRVENITLTNISAAYRDTGEKLAVRKHVSEKSMSGYPDITRVSHIYFINHEFSGYWDLPCYSLFVRHAAALDYSGYRTVPRSCNERAEYYLEDVNA